MIIGTGIDTVLVARFADWHTWNKKQLLRIFSTDEMTYCLSNHACSAERFAVRYAAREALFKAVSAAAPEHTIPFFTLCRVTRVTQNTKGAPLLYVDWEQLEKYLEINASEWKLHLSMSHTKQDAIAWVVIEYKDS